LALIETIFIKSHQIGVILDRRQLADSSCSASFPVAVIRENRVTLALYHSGRYRATGRIGGIGQKATV
jgi:hypothetical protein